MSKKEKRKDEVMLLLMWFACIAHIKGARALIAVLTVILRLLGFFFCPFLQTLLVKIKKFVL